MTNPRSCNHLEAPLVTPGMTRIRDSLNYQMRRGVQSRVSTAPPNPEVTGAVSRSVLLMLYLIFECRQLYRRQTLTEL
jgi:hypothetical protein